VERAWAGAIVSPPLATKTRAPEFVSFHADRPAGAGEVHPNANLGSASYMRMLDLLYRSARLFHPGAACTLLTDASTQVRGIRGKVRRFDQPIDHASLMLSRSKAQLACVDASTFDRPLVLLDSDILLNGSLQPVFEEDFDVGLTWRASRTMPINGGLLVLHNRRPEVARAFFRKFVALYVERYGSDNNASWYGDQLALHDLVGLTHQQMQATDLVVKDGCRIRLLPCDRFNFSPDNRLAAIVDGLPEKAVLHFKGQRKRLMEPFWTAFLQWRESFWPWAARQGRRAQQVLRDEAAAEERATAAPAAAKADA
jgi:hypothetical protein